jgi:hypothetical protein
MVDRRKRWTRKSDTIWNVISLLTAIHRLERNDPSKQYGSKSAWVLRRVNPEIAFPFREYACAWPYERLRDEVPGRPSARTLARLTPRRNKERPRGQTAGDPVGIISVRPGIERTGCWRQRPRKARPLPWACTFGLYLHTPNPSAPQAGFFG